MKINGFTTYMGKKTAIATCEHQLPWVNSVFSFAQTTQEIAPKTSCRSEWFFCHELKSEESSNKGLNEPIFVFRVCLNYAALVLVFFFFGGGDCYGEGNLAARHVNECL